MRWSASRKRTATKLLHQLPVMLMTVMQEPPAHDQLRERGLRRSHERYFQLYCQLSTRTAPSHAVGEQTYTVLDLGDLSSQLSCQAGFPDRKLTTGFSLKKWNILHISLTVALKRKLDS